MIATLEPVAGPVPHNTRMAAAKHYHVPVLLAETLALLQPAPGKLFVDGTLGGGGHAEAFLEHGAAVIGIDQDPEAIAFAKQRLARFGERFTAITGNFAHVELPRMDGALLDIGVSSRQLETPERGFSFQHEGPLDMRMNPDAQLTAAALVNSASGEELERIFREYGEEPSARRVAAQITRDRIARPFVTTLDLVRSVEAVIPRRGKTHPATRVFQALRVAVNLEMAALDAALQRFTENLRSGGRFAVITFHSLEDRKVKAFFKQRSVETIDRPEWPAPRPNPDLTFRPVTRKPVVATAEEQHRNPRSRSAKLRVVEKI